MPFSVVPALTPVVAINLVATLKALFGYVNVRSLRRLGIQLSRQESEDFIMMWRWAGWFNAFC
jgi:hypothetical protein